jgi:hypothetical protein
VVVAPQTSIDVNATLGDVCSSFTSLTSLQATAHHAGLAAATGQQFIIIIGLLRMSQQGTRKKRSGRVLTGQ